MLTIIAFLLTILGCLNWFLIGVLQYDFVAGIFGFQGSILSRIIYVIIGVASFFLVFKLIKGKGTLAVFSRRNKKDIVKNIAKVKDKKFGKANASNVEASSEQFPHEEDEEVIIEEEDYEEHGIFNEHFGNRQ
jgi:hypothetical protein